jgi:hypothetical protein
MCSGPPDTVAVPRQALTSTDVTCRDTASQPRHADLPSRAVVAHRPGPRPVPAPRTPAQDTPRSRNTTGDPWHYPAAAMSMTTRPVQTLTAPGSRAGSTAKAGRTATPKAGWKAKPPGTRPGPPPLLAVAEPAALVLAAARHHSDPIGLALIAVAVAVVWALSVLARPIAACRACGGQRVIRTARRARICRACKGRGTRARFGASAIHRFYQSLPGKGRSTPAPRHHDWRRESDWRHTR